MRHPYLSKLKQRVPELSTLEVLEWVMSTWKTCKIFFSQAKWIKM